MDDKCTVLINGKEEQYEDGTSYEEIARAHQDEYDAPIILANVNGKLCELHKSLSRDCTISFDTVKERTGYATYRRSALFMMIKAIRRERKLQARESRIFSFTCALLQTQRRREAG